MADKDGNTKSERRKPRNRLRYFFLNDKLHRKLHIDRASDVITAWSYPDKKRVGYTYSDVLRRYARAITTTEVSQMINRKSETILEAVKNGDIESPQRAYSIETGYPKAYLWREQDVMNLHDYLSTVHKGRPRLDKLITPQAMPTKRELRALIHQQEIFYVKNNDGEFVPTWQAKDF